MAERRDPEGNLDPCGSCMATEAPMVFAGTPWCSDSCRKQMVTIAGELRDLAERQSEAYRRRKMAEDCCCAQTEASMNACPVHGPHGPGDPDLVHDFHVRGPHTSAFWIKFAKKPEDVDCQFCLDWAKARRP